MADLPSERQMIQVEETQFRFAVSESLMQKAGRAINFINERQHSEKQFFANGRYGIMASYPQEGVDGLTFFEFDAEIINVWAFSLVPGSGGTTELDVELLDAPGGTFTSIFSQTPTFDSTSDPNSYVDAQGTITPGTGVVEPILDITDIDAGQALRFNIISAMTGDPENCGIIIHYRPR